MALKTYPLNNVDYSAEDAELFHCTRSSGIYANDDFDYSVTGADNIITIGVGLGWIRNNKFSGKVAALKAPISLDMGLPDAVHPRIDAVVIQFDANKNATEIVVKKGASASTPVAPAVSRSEALYELHLYHVRREPGATAISVSKVTDIRLDSKYCGLMADSVTKVDTAAIAAQANALLEELRKEIQSAKNSTVYLMRSGGTMTGPIDMNGQELNGLNTPNERTAATNKGYVDNAVKIARPHNLLDNSDFRSPVNQNGRESYSTEGNGLHTIDRWRTYHAGDTVTVSNGYISVSHRLYQVITAEKIDTSKTYTAAAMKTDGTMLINVRRGISADQSGAPSLYLNGQIVTFRLSNGGNFVWAALYEGEYTVDTLPEYQPKGHAAELLICRQYDPETGVYIGLRKLGYSHNLLDNSDFRNPVNQRGQGNYTLGTAIDRWQIFNEGDSVDVNQGYISKNGVLTQILKGLDSKKKYTAVICENDGKISVYTGLLQAGIGGWTSKVYCDVSASGAVNFRITSSANDIKWVALYEGEYTLETLPEYYPKGFENERLVCRQYDPMSGAYIGLTGKVTFSGKLLASSWAATSGGYYQNIAVPGIHTTDLVGQVDLDTSAIGTTGTEMLQVQVLDQNWSNIYRCRIMSDGNVRFYAHAKPSVDLPFKIVVWR